MVLRLRRPYCQGLRKSSSPSKWWVRTGGVPPSLPRAPRPTPRARSLDRSHPLPPSLASETLTPAVPSENNVEVEAHSTEIPRLSPNPKSRSYDNILDNSDNSDNVSSENTPENERINDNQQLTRSCENELDRLEEDSSEQSEPPRRAQSCEGLLQAAPRQSSMLSLQTDSPGGTKRKKNFMDRCVHKVRSLVLRK